MPARGHVGYRSARGGPVYDSLGNMVTRLPLLWSKSVGTGVLEGTAGMRIGSTAGMLHLERGLPSSALLCGSVGLEVPAEMRASPLFIEEPGRLSSDLWEWQVVEYMTGCYEMSVRVSADSSVDETSMHRLFHSVQVQPSGDVTLVPQPGAKGTALVRATAYARRIPDRMPPPFVGGEVEGGYELFWASVARVNKRPAMQVFNVSLTVSFEDDAQQQQPLVAVFARHLSAGAPTHLL
jgi:hypothetical protein